ncbi:MAG: hypothetical protein AVDCRST_MAG69-1714 [uncultured Solirubrobacteraceae bacterium]|uniref:EfeO-type cupredoxin-like domain-containing protein n=1 Tax=uncultured Solirubrobacteraceae bacterium TaxID=1162706 RepID=A0A6J4SFX8_9ACTN|nr:MAG: hypothetical protein AVDCRST_MAG69-1714 [uncultured Solirubrobacteraceae bacterium]
MNKGIIAFLAFLAVVLLGIGIWTATPMGGGGLGEEGVAAGGAGGVATPESPESEKDRSEGVVNIVDGRFEPETVEVIGQANVSFINRDDVPHGLDFEDESIEDVERIAPGAAHVVKMPGDGRYAFSDPADPGLKGTVVVGG